jgi:hypothetical protein
MRKLLVLFAVVPFMFAFTTPAKADVNLSGYVAFETYMQNVDSDEPGYKDADDLIWDLDNICSRLTINFKQGPVGAIYELRPFSGGHVRHWFATWNFGAATLGIGQFWTPEFSCISSALRGCGAVGPAGDPGCSVRIPFVQVQFGSLKIAAGKPNIPDANIYGDDFETSMPKLMFSYDLNVAMVGLKFFGGYQSIDDRDSATDVSKSIDSYVAGITATLGFGPATVKVYYWTAENPIEYGSGNAGFEAVLVGNTVKDADFNSYGVDLAYKVSDTLQVTAGYLLGSSESDQAGKWEDDSTAYHVNATFTLAKGVTLSPEYAVLDLEDKYEAGVKSYETSTTWLGAYWKIAF